MGRIVIHCVLAKRPPEARKKRGARVRALLGKVETLQAGELG